MYHITHFARRPSEKDGSWIMLGYITRDHQGIFRFGLENIQHFTQDEIDSRVTGGPLIEIKPAVEFDPQNNVALWLEGPDDASKVWLASRESPINDPGKRMVWSGAMFKSIR